MKKALLMFCLACTAAAHAMAAGQAQNPASDLATARTMRIQDVCRMLSGTALRFDTVFAESFLRQVSPAQLTMGIGQITRETGACTGTTMAESPTPTAVHGEAVMAKGFTIPFDMSIENAPPYRIVGLLLKPPMKATTSWTEITASLQKLPGTTSAYAMNLSTGAVAYTHNPDAMLPIGSAHKLYTLGTLAAAVKAGTRSWADVTTLDSSRYALPSGILHTWPHGSPLTLHTLAAEMISISDNTATDHLLYLLGRQNVEAMQATMHHRQPERNIPFMSTLEMFKLKFTQQAHKAREYMAADAARRRTILDADLKKIPREEVEYVPTPILADSLEWFATTQDLVKAMDWFRTEAHNDMNNTALQVLAINDGLNLDGTTWPYAGYKGGSEAGVINMTYLLKRKDGTWYALSASWTNPKEALDDPAFFGIVGGMLKQLEQER